MIYDIREMIVLSKKNTDIVMNIHMNTFIRMSIILTMMPLHISIHTEI